ncbi:Uma2 family endonuclease [Crocosphaera sp. UHCC 0190]|uniref:Uma2 family endonuclease n=1 Tax=Crocosphaera sp. UHCC 0190 TaxID=3110246 RepID=UPI002B212B2D|nr:Uma2 family endonuclease [Crocosphaera sp. UHCC 0190]MEA5510443.1 Uma2 family endonuclease [Crocosphaera sp. UHCC 0190]
MLTIAKWSVEDYHKMIETGILNDRPVELLEGTIIEMSPEGPLHRKKCDTVAEYLREKLKGYAKVYEAHPVTLSNSEPEPDIAIVRLPVSLYDTRHPYPEDIYWLIEISDTTLTKDLEEKRLIYAKAGIREYWVIEVEKKQLRVFKDLAKYNYQQEQIYTKVEISPLAFPEIKLLVKNLVE